MYPEYYYSHEEQNWDELESHAGEYSQIGPERVLNRSRRPLFGKFEADAAMSTGHFGLHAGMDTP
jgi:hypothetical protein